MMKTTNETNERDVAHYIGMEVDGRMAKGEPFIGWTFTTERLGKVNVVRVHPFGTVDVVTESGRYYRITGLGAWEGK